MALTTFKIGKKEYVIVPRRRYEQLTRAEQDQRDGEIATKGREDYLSGKMKTITHEELKKRLGLKRWLYQIKYKMALSERSNVSISNSSGES